MSSETHTASSDSTAIQGHHEADNGVTTAYQLRRNNYGIEDVMLLLLFLLGFGLVGFVIYSLHIAQAYVPPLTFKVVSLEVASMTISNNSSSGFHKYMSADVNLTLSLTNKNEQLLIEPLLVSIMYDDEFLSSKNIDPLYLSSLNNKSIQLDMGITASQLNVVTVDSISTDLAINHSLVFKIVIQGRYSILKSGHIHDDIYGVAVTCDGVKVNFFFSVESNLTAGSLINGPCSCKHIVA